MSRVVADVPPKTTLLLAFAQNRAMTNANDQDLVKRTIRIPKALADEIQLAAQRHDLSVNTEIINRLRGASAAERYDALTAEVAELKAMIRRVLASIG